MSIPTKLTRIRESLQAASLDAYLIPSHDEHLNEFPPAWRKRREIVSGFTGSAGDLLIGLEEAWLFVDGRYHLQADTELAGSGITPVKLGLANTPNLPEHLDRLARNQPGFTLGLCSETIPLVQAELLARTLKANGGELRPTEDFVAEVWAERPAPSTDPLLSVEPEWAGQSVDDKLKMLRQSLEDLGADGTVVTRLDEIAWLLNLRSLTDVPFNPVFEAYLTVDSKSLHLFVHEGKARRPAQGWEIDGKAEVHEHEAFGAFLSKWKPPTRRQGPPTVAIDPRGNTLFVAETLRSAGWRVLRALSPIEEGKAIKNSAEREAARRANLAASAAKTRSLLWLRRRHEAGHCETERSFAHHLEEEYARCSDYFGLSFATISSVGANSAVIHYGGCDETPIAAGELFLIDSGAHLAGGSTDDTRTVVLGSPTKEQRRLYTLVLRGHIRTAAQAFPLHTPAAALDTLARSPLWAERLNYPHGTGHGVGAFLNIHEGPFGISDQMRRPAAIYPLKANMLTSIEPGYYRAGWGGIRIENLYLTREVDEGTEEEESGAKWLELECLTWIPLDRGLIDDSLLNPEEKDWIDHYHHECAERLAALLEPEEMKGLGEWMGI